MNPQANIAVNKISPESASLFQQAFNLSVGSTALTEFKGRLIRLHRYRDQLSMIDITDGCKAGKMALKANISFPDSYPVDAFQTSLEWFSIVLDMLLSNEWPPENSKLSQTFLNIRCHAYLIKTNNLLNERNLKPLPAVPVKWTLRHVARALANNQYIPGSLHCDGHYTDDYAYDAAVNFGKGPVSHQALLKELVEDPSGYRTWSDALDNGSLKVHVACHQFLYYSFYFCQ